MNNDQKLFLLYAVTLSTVLINRLRIAYTHAFKVACLVFESWLAKEQSLCTKASYFNKKKILKNSSIHPHPAKLRTII